MTSPSQNRARPIRLRRQGIFTEATKKLARKVINLSGTTTLVKGYVMGEENLGAASCSFIPPGSVDMPETLGPTDAYVHREGVLFVDVRTPAEYREVHIGGSLSRPLGSIDVSEVKRLGAGKSGVVLVCKGGTRARTAAKSLKEQGLEAISVLDGGVQGWVEAGLPVERNDAATCSVMSLERQVRIVAGALVFVGSMLGLFFNPLWCLLSGFVGAGLVFAGVTDTCGMAMVLAKMPWNR